LSLVPFGYLGIGVSPDKATVSSITLETFTLFELSGNYPLDMGSVNTYGLENIHKESASSEMMH